MNEIIYTAFFDEMEKLAGLPAAVRRGGGGEYGRTLRNRAKAGKTSAYFQATLERRDLPYLQKAYAGGDPEDIREAKGIADYGTQAAAEGRDLGRSIKESESDVLKKHRLQRKYNRAVRQLKSRPWGFPGEA